MSSERSRAARRGHARPDRARAVALPGRGAAARPGITAPPDLATATAFECLDYVASNVLLPLGGFGLAIFGGWIIQAGALGDELGLGPRALRGITFLLRYVVPIGIVAASVAPFVLR